MILVDSSVWIDYFNGQLTPQTDLLDKLLGHEPLALGDLILAEVLQGFRHDKDFHTTRKLLTAFDVYPLVDQTIAIKSAQNYRLLRRAGITIRKTIDVIIATFCLEHDFVLLHSDRDFIPFSTELKLRSLF